MSIWSNMQTLERLEKIRDKKRGRNGRIAFDCFKLCCKDDRAYCREGVKFNQANDGTVNLISVLRGTTPQKCKKCLMFDTE